MSQTEQGSRKLRNSFGLLRRATKCVIPFTTSTGKLGTDASARYGVDAMKSTVSELTRQQAENERTLKVNKLTTILSVALITISFTATLSLYKNNNLRARANDFYRRRILN